MTDSDIQHYVTAEGASVTNKVDNFFVIWPDADKPLEAIPALAAPLATARIGLVNAWADTAKQPAGSQAASNALGVASAQMAEVYKQAGFAPQDIEARMQTNLVALRNALNNAQYARKGMQGQAGNWQDLVQALQAAGTMQR